MGMKRASFPVFLGLTSVMKKSAFQANGGVFF